MQRTHRTNRFIASVALTTAALLGVVAVPGIASAAPASSVAAQHWAINAAHPAQTSAPVTGTVTDFHSNDDGDIDIRIDVDQPYLNLLNDGNISNLNGHLQTEAICQAPPTVANAIQACRGFAGSVAVPAVGAHVQVTGSYVFDTNHGWMEVHPISALSVR